MLNIIILNVKIKFCLINNKKITNNFTAEFSISENKNQINGFRS